jgi:D-glycero-D-manno-heptose 1,7-bisphosphate phosphatase
VSSHPGASARPIPVRRALFVDRDGTLNPDLHYLKEAYRLELCRGVGDALALAHDHGYLVVCVTNQSGVERGFYTDEDVGRLHARLNELLRPFRTRVDAFYYCPHTPEHGCDCRKPRTGLFEQAQREWNIEFSSSAVVGDRAIDIEAGRSLGLLTALVPPRGHEAEVREELARRVLTADLQADTFPSAVGRILSRG